MNRNSLRSLSRAVFLLGAILGFALAIITNWSRVEAVHYYFEGIKYEQFKGLRCPLMIAPKEKGVVTAVFNNPTDQEINLFYRVEVSGTEASANVPEQIAVPPQQTKSITLTVDASNVDLQYFIFVKLNVLPNSLHSSKEAVCGIMIADVLGLPGGQLSAVALSLSFVSMSFALSMGQGAGTIEDPNAVRVMQALGVSVLLTLLTGAMGWWLAGMVLSAITILLMIVFIHLIIA